MKLKARTLTGDILKALAIAVIYVAAAQLGQLFQLKPYDVVFYWPAAGVALGIILVFEKQALFGIALGALATVSAQGILGQPPMTASIAAASVAAWTLQPLVALKLLKKLTPLQAFWERPALWYRGIAIILVASLVPPCIVICTLYVTDIIPLSEVLSTLTLSSLGQFLGMLTVVPLSYYTARYLGAGAQGKIVGPFYYVIIFSLTILLVTAFFTAASKSEERSIKSQLARESLNVTNNFELLIGNLTKEVRAVTSFFNSNTSVSKEQYKRFSLALIERDHFHPGLESVSWVHHHLPSQVLEHENNSLLTIDPSNQSSVADNFDNPGGSAAHDIYFPIHLIHPWNSNKAVIGLNLGDQEGFRKGFNQAKETKKVSSIFHYNPIPWLQSQPTLVLIDVVYNPQNDQTLGVTATAAPMGYVVAEYLIRPVLDAAELSAERDIEISIFDIHNPNTETPIWTNALASQHYRDNDAPDTTFNDIKSEKTAIYWSTTTFPTDNFKIVTAVQPVVFQSLGTSIRWWGAIAILIIGMAITYLVLLFERTRGERLRSMAMRDAIVVSARQPFVHLDENGIVLEWNNAAQRVFGWTTEQALHRKLTETLIPARYHEAHSNGMQRFKDTGKGPVIGNVVSLEALCADTTELPVDLLINAVQVDNEWHFFAFINDITTRKNAENILQVAHDKYTALFESIPDAIVTYNELGVIEDVNGAAVALFGWPREELINQSYKKIVSQRSEQHLSDMHEYGDSTIIWPGNSNPIFAVRRDGSEFAFEAVVNYQDTESGVKFISLVRDITSRIETQDQRDSTRKWEALGQMTRILAHDFNNLFAIIIGNLDLARDRASNTTIDSSISDRIDVAHDAAIRGTEVVKSLRAVGTDQPPPLASIDIVQMIGAILPLLLSDAGDKITVDIETTEKQLLVNADHNWLSEAIQNLVINARESIIQNGKITITLRKAQATEIDDPQQTLQKGQYAVIIVSDTGQGMNTADLKRAFDPFFTTKKRNGNKGLGLSMVAKMSKQLGGLATIDSRLDEGSVISIYLPLLDSNVASLTASNSDLDSGPEKIHILVVDDQDEILTLAVLWLKKAGYPVKSTNNPNVALEIMKSSTPTIDLLVTDMLMPSMDGISLSQLASEINPSIKVLYMTGFLDKSVEDSANAKGFAILEKPFRKDDFLTAVHSILHSASTKI